MKKYIYKAKNAAGKLVTGEVEASSPSYAAKLVRERNLIVLSIHEARGNVIDAVLTVRSKISSTDISTFTRQLSTMINAGLPITESLSILRSQTKPALQPIIGQILADIEGGEPLSTAFARHPLIFSATYVALIKSGETGGVLDKILARLADDLEKQEEFQGKIKGALIYPIIIVVGMIMVAFIMMIFVVPRLTSLYTEFNATLPLPTKILIGISNLTVAIWPVLLLGIIGGVWGYGKFYKTPFGRRRIDELKFRIPIYGPLMKEIYIADLSRTLALMVGSGVSVLEGLSVTAGVIGNMIISDALKDVAKQIEKGFPMAYSFAQHPEAFPYLFSQMVAVGEETGKMEEVLIKISRVMEVESDQKVKTLTAAIEPIVMMILGLGVGFLVVSIILPIYNLTSQF